MNKAYYRINNGEGWEDYPSDKTPLNKYNLDKGDVALDEIDNRVIVLDNTKATKVEVSPLFKEVAYDERTGIITFTRKNGATVTIDTPMEKIALNIYYDPITEMLTLPLIDGTQMQVDLSRLITEYEFVDSDTIAFSIKPDGKVTAIVKEGSIEEKHLRPDYLADIKTEVAKAQASQQAAATSETNAKKSEDAAKASQVAAKTSETNAAASSSSASGSALTATEKASEATNSAAAAKVSETNSKSSEVNSKTSETNAELSKISAANSATSANSSASTATQKATEARDSALQSKSYAVGGTGTRENENIDNSQYYYSQCKSISEGIAGTLMAMGTVTFANLPSLSSVNSGWMYNISDQFTTTSSFKEGAGNIIPAGANVYKTADGYWDVLAGSTVAGVKGNAESNYRKGLVNITPENIGAVPASGGEFSGPVHLRQGSIVKKFGGIDGTHGYVKIAQLTVIAYYVNDPIIFEIGGRGWSYSRKLYVYFASGNTLDPGLGNFWIDNPAPYTVCIVKSAASTWDIYMQKSEAYGRCYICSLCNTYGGVDIDYPGTQVSSLPSNVIYPEIITWHYAHAIKDSADNRDITFSYSNAELTVEQAQHLAAWSRHELRAIGFPKVKTLIGLGSAENTADRDKYVKGVIDYGDTNRKIQIGYGGTGLTPDNADFIAAYTDNGRKIKDLSFANLKTKLGVPAAVAVKGNAETSYRTGNVNLTPANIGAVNKGGDTMSGALNLANNTWNRVGDDAEFGDHNSRGGIGIRGVNGTTRLNFLQTESNTNYKSITYDGTTLYLDGDCKNADYAKNTDKLGGYTWQGTTNNTRDTWLLCMTGNAIQHREVGSLPFLPTSGGVLSGSISFNWQNTGDNLDLRCDNNTALIRALKTALYIQCKQGSAGIGFQFAGTSTFAPIYAASFTVNSSRRYKENISPITDRRAKAILDVDVVTYDYSEGIVSEESRHNRTGVIAEDAANVIPEAVAYKEIDGEMVPEGVDYSRFVPYLIRITQMQQERIDILEKRIEKLEERDLF